VLRQNIVKRKKNEEKAKESQLQEKNGSEDC